MDVEDSIANIQDATMSANGGSWNDETGNELEVDDDGGDSEVDAGKARSYRAIAARLNYIYHPTDQTLDMLSRKRHGM